MDSYKPQKTKGFYRFGEFEIEVEERCLRHGEKMVPLTPKEFEVLFFLIERSEKIVEKRDLLDAIWSDTFVEEATLARNISWLRKKLRKFSNGEKFIETIPKRGYRFVGEVIQHSKNENLLIIEEETFHEVEVEETLSYEDSELKKHLNENIALPEKTSVSKRRNFSKFLLISTFFIGLIVLGGIGFILYHNYEQNDRPKILVAKKVVPLTGERGREQSMSFSPDGNQIVYTWNEGKGVSDNIYVRLVNGGKPVQLTDSNVKDSYPTFSRNGQNVAFLRDYKDYGELITIPALGGTERIIRRIFSGNYSISFSPDGKYIAAIDTENSEIGGQYAIHLFDTKTSERRRLTASGDFSGETTPRFSPDGKSIAFIRLYNKSKQDMFIVPASGGEPRQITFDGKTITSIAWSPNSEMLYFVSPRDGNKPRLWRVLASGGEPEIISIEAGRIGNIALSPNGSTLAFSAIKNRESIHRVRIDESTSQEILISSNSNLSPRFSRDGSKIVFISNRKGNQDIWTADSDGENLLRITDSMNAVASPSFSPDGSKIVFSGHRKGKGGIFVVSSQGGEVRHISTESHAAWSNDGEWIYFASKRTGRYEIWKIKSDGSGEEIQITKDGGFIPKPTFDGKMLYYTKSRFSGGIWRVSVDGGFEEEVKAFTENGYKHFVKNKLNESGSHWTMTKKGIYFLTVDTDKNHKIKFYDFATEKVSEILSKDKIPPTAQTSFETNGKDFLFTVRESRDSNIMLANLSQ